MGRYDRFDRGGPTGDHPTALLVNYMYVGEAITPLLNLGGVITLYFATRSGGSKRLLWAAGGGACFGLAALFNANLLLGLAAAPLVILIAVRDVKKTLLISCAVLVTAVLMLTPWTIRNYALTGRLIPLRTQGGVLLYGSNNPLTVEKEYFRGRHIFFKKDWESFRKAGWQEWEIDDYYREKTAQYLRENPEVIPRLLWYKFSFYWTPYKSNLSGFSKWAYFVFFLPVLLAIVPGLIYAIRNGPRDALYMAIPFLSSQVGCLIYFAGNRFRYPAEPFILIVAAAGFYFVFRMAQKAIARKRSTANVDLH